MTQFDDWSDMRVLLVGSDAALLEGLAQSFAAQGYAPRVVATVADARDAASARPPLLAVVERGLAAAASADALAIPLAPGGALMIYQLKNDDRAAISPALQRLVMAELVLPLERNRLLALAQHVHDRVIAAGRSLRRTPPEQRAL
jgi:DNA-binding NtrC family response regulator